MRLLTRPPLLWSRAPDDEIFAPDAVHRTVESLRDMHYFRGEFKPSHHPELPNLQKMHLTIDGVRINIFIEWMERRDIAGNTLAKFGNEPAVVPDGIFQPQPSILQETVTTLVAAGFQLGVAHASPGWLVFAFLTSEPIRFAPHSAGVYVRVEAFGAERPGPPYLCLRPYYWAQISLRHGSQTQSH